MSSNTNEMDALVARADKLISAVTGAIMSSVEAGAERLELASRVAQVQGRMAAFGAVLESVGSAKAALLARLDKAPAGPVRALLEAQVAALAAQELAVLERAGVPQAAASAALAAVDAGGGAGGREATHRRDGKRFVAVACRPGVNGAGVNGAGGGHADGDNGAAG